MSKNGLHPSVLQFKEFMGRNPHLIKEVSENNKSLQELFEEWSVFGEEHEHWSTYMTTEKEPDRENSENNKEKQEETTNAGATNALGQIMGLVSKLNFDDLQQHLNQFSSVLGNVQNVVQSFQKQPDQKHQQPNDHPFSFRRD